MTTTMNLIARQTVGADGAASVTFSNIPQTFTDLKLVISGRASRTQPSAAFTVLFNGSTANHTNVYVRGAGSGTPVSYTGASIYYNMGEATGDISTTANTFSSGELYITNYTSSNNKSFGSENVSENNATEAYATLGAGLWSNSAPITSIEVGLRDYSGSVSWLQFSEFSLYGISSSSTQNTSVPLASGGDVITTDGSFWYHAFKYSGSFVPLKNLTADVLVIAGGGSGGGRFASGGGGAGGYRVLTAQALTNATNYTCSIGAGGASQTNTATVGNSGVNSSFAGTGFTTITSTGGGGGGSSNGVTLVNALTGGSGGGGAYNTNGAAGNAGSFSPVEGFAGANGSLASTATGGGGGGASAVGSSTYPAAGGAGSNSVSSWASATSTGVSGFYAGGGGGGTDNADSTGGAGGGGAGGGSGRSGAAGVVNTGSGGGGSAGGPGSPNPGAGGSGIIVVRYAV